MDAITLLKNDHREVKALFAEVKALGEKAHVAREKLFAKIDAALSLHAEIEEKIFYPAFKERTKPATDERSEILEATEEHAVAKTLIGELRSLDCKDETYAAKLTVLMENVEHHVKEEEGTMFKMARELFDAPELTELGARLSDAKSSVPVA